MRVNFFGIGISVTTKNKQLADIENLVSKKQTCYITYTNVHVVITAKKDKALKEAVNGASIVSPDGMPLVWASRLKGITPIERCCGPDMMEMLLLSSVKKGFSNYFYGSSVDTLALLRKKLVEKYPGIIISGMHSPPFRKLSQVEDKQIIDEINKLSPDIIWVGLGAPKQEIWMYEHLKQLNGTVMLGVGAAFDFLADILERAPGWMHKCGLEWLFRLYREPVRLWKRYLETNSKFFLYFFTDYLFKKEIIISNKSKD